MTASYLTTHSIQDRPARAAAPRLSLSDLRPLPSSPLANSTAASAAAAAASSEHEVPPPPAYSCAPTYVTCAGTTWVSTASAGAGAGAAHTASTSSGLQHISNSRPFRRQRRRRLRPIVIETRCLDESELDDSDDDCKSDAASMGKISFFASDDKEFRTSFGRGGAGNLRRVSEAQHAHQMLVAMRATNAAAASADADAAAADASNTSGSDSLSSSPHQHRRSSVASWVDSLRRKVSLSSTSLSSLSSSPPVSRRQTHSRDDDQPRRDSQGSVSHDDALHMKKAASRKAMPPPPTTALPAAEAEVGAGPASSGRGGDAHETGN